MQQLLFMVGMAEFVNSVFKLALLVTIAPLLVRAWRSWIRAREQRLDEQLGRQSGAWSGHQAPPEQHDGWKSMWIIAMLLVWGLLLVVVTSLSGLR